MINYPTSLDNFSNPTPSSPLKGGVVPHATLHSDANDAIEQLEAKVGINGSAVTTSHDYKLSAVTGSEKALTSGTSTQSVTGLTLVTPRVNLGSDATGDMYFRNSGGTLSRLPIGSAGQVVAASVSGTPEFVTIGANQDASTTVKGVVEIATTAEINAGTATGGTGARLVVTPDQLLTSSYATIANTVNAILFGDGSDGAVTVNSGSFSSGPITNNALTRDAFFTNLTINSTFTLNTNGYRIYVNGTLLNNGTIRNNGNNASGLTAGTGGAGGSLPAGRNGGNGAIGGGTPGGGGGGGGIVFISAKTFNNANTIQALGGNGANGVASVGGAFNSGNVGQNSVSLSASTATGGNGGGGGSNTGGTNTQSLISKNNFFVINNWYDAFNNSPIMGGASGGGGSRADSSAGGGGGGAGGTIYIFYQTLTASGTLQVTGGTGGTGQNATNGTSGGNGISLLTQIA